MEIIDKISNDDEFSHGLFSDEDLAASPMRKYFKGKTVFLTGGTGFMGQLLLEKLLRCDAERIFILTRTKKNKPPLERFQALFEEVQFSKLRKYNPDFMQHISIIEGDMLKLGIGINESDLQLMQQSVEIVLHAAADVRFNESLQELVMTNLRGTRELLKIATNFKKLQVFNYISTAYSNCAHGDNVRESFYKAPIDPETIIAYAERCGTQPEELQNFNIVTDILLGTWPNTYTFSKSLSEDLVHSYANKFPICVVRPSIIISTYEEPLPAWCNNVYGLTGILTALGSGLARIICSKYETVYDVVCADFAINACLTATWDTHQLAITETAVGQVPQPRVYAIVSSKNFVTLGLLKETLLGETSINPPANAVWKVTINYTTCPFLLMYLTLYYHFLAGLLIDFSLKITKREARVLPMIRKIQVFFNALSFFSCRIWNFENSNMTAAYERMHPIDKKLFDCDTRQFNFSNWCLTYLQGMKQYIMKDDLNKYEQARIKYSRTKILHNFVLILFYFSQAVIIYYLAKIFGIVAYTKDTIAFFKNPDITI